MATIGAYVVPPVIGFTETAEVLTLVSLPYVSYVMTGMSVPLPDVPADTPDTGRSDAAIYLNVGAPDPPDTKNCPLLPAADDRIWLTVWA